MTVEQWKKAENMLSTVLGFVKMKVDGYDITIQYAKEKPTKYVLAVYVNGEIRGEWLAEDCEIRRKFCYCGERQILSSKQKKKIFAGLTKREQTRFEKENRDRLYYKYYTPYFNSFRTLKAHLIKNNKSIELIEKNIEL